MFWLNKRRGGNKRRGPGTYALFSKYTGQDAKWEKLEKIDKIVDEMYWYDKKLFELYYTEKNTLDSLHKKTGISRNSLFTTIQKVRYIIKDKIKDE